jgi:hypothetical protein
LQRKKTESEDIMNVRKIILCIALVFGISTVSIPSFAFLNNFDTASILEKGSVRGKLGVAVSDDFFTFSAGANYGIYEGLEVSGKLGFLDADVEKDKTGFLLGIGGKYKAAFFDNPSYPDIALTGTYDFGFADGSVLHSLAAGILASKPFPNSKGSVTVTPYGGPEVEVLGGSMNDDTDINLHLTLGTEVYFEKQFGIAGEVKIGGNSSLGVSLIYLF